MSLEIYKKGQGKWARGCAYLLLGLLLLFGCIRLHATINRPNRNIYMENIPLVGDVTLYKVIALVAFLAGLLLLHLVLNRAKAVDALVECENEMRKVSWPSGREVKSASIVVVVVTFIMGGALFGFDKIVRRVFNLFF